MLALAEHRAYRCKGCGNDVRATTAMEGTHKWRVRQVRCWSCDELMLRQDAASEKPRAGSLLWSVLKDD